MTHEEIEQQTKILREVTSPMLGWILACKCGALGETTASTATLAASRFVSDGWRWTENVVKCPKCAAPNDIIGRGCKPSPE